MLEGVIPLQALDEELGEVLVVFGRIGGFALASFPHLWFLCGVESFL